MCQAIKLSVSVGRNVQKRAAAAAIRAKNAKRIQRSNLLQVKEIVARSIPQSNILISQREEGVKVLVSCFNCINLVLRNNVLYLTIIAESCLGLEKKPSVLPNFISITFCNLDMS